jgi:hypothetical protein
MKQLLVAAARISAEDAVADAVLDYEAELIEHHRTARVVIPVFMNEGDTLCELFLGRGAIDGALALPNTAGRRIVGSEAAVRELRERVRVLREQFSAPFDEDWYSVPARDD